MNKKDVKIMPSVDVTDLIAKRDEKNLSQQELADLIGVARQTINNWEENITQPRVDLYKLWVATLYDDEIETMAQEDDTENCDEVFPSNDAEVESTLQCCQICEVFNTFKWNIMPDDYKKEIQRSIIFALVPFFFGMLSLVNGNVIKAIAFIVIGIIAFKFYVGNTYKRIEFYTKDYITCFNPEKQYSCKDCQKWRKQ